MRKTINTRCSCFLRHNLFLFNFHSLSAMGPILPQLAVFGKEMGISSVVMGTINGILPILFLLAKPLFGIIVDVYRNYRKTIFMGLIVVMTTSYALMNVIPSRRLETYVLGDLDCHQLDTCNVTVSNKTMSCSRVFYCGSGMWCFCKTLTPRS